MIKKLVLIALIVTTGGLAAIGQTGRRPAPKKAAPEVSRKPVVLTDAERAENLKKAAITLYQGGDNEGAIAKFTAALALDPQNAEIVYWRGTTYIRTGEHDLAIADLNRAIELKPGMTEAYGDRDRAIKVKEMLRDLLSRHYAIRDDSSPEGCNNIGHVYASAGNQKRAIEFYDKGIALNPRLAVLYSNRGKAYAKRFMFAKAVADFTKAIELKPEGLEAYTDRAAAYEKLGDLRRAKADCAKIAAETPGKMSDGIKVVAISVPPPEYPEQAKKAGITGTVIVQILIDVDGTVIEAAAISGPSELMWEATMAAGLAKFKPTIVNGRPIKVSGTIRYNFEK